MTKEKKLTFGGIFKKSFREYTDNFGEIFKFVLLFIGIPYLLFFLAQVIMLLVDPNLFSMISTPDSLVELNSGTLKLPLYFRIINGIFNVINVFMSIFVSAGLISIALKKSKFSFKELKINAKARYWKFVGFSIVVAFFVMLLVLLLIIPGIIFGVYWAFAAYIFFDKKEKIMASLKQSRKIVKGRWWKTFGYLLLIGIIIALIIILLSAIQLPVILITMIKLAAGESLSMGLLITSAFLSSISGLISGIVSLLAVIFLKNFYLEMKK